mmetsp:Transcript_2423/g.6163  ORF Transcript_2423/g.6163 Transcript_2423/m.6163 type:complete len:680 (-) Transcript_2423:1220-3259(-)
MEHPRASGQWEVQAGPSMQSAQSMWYPGPSMVYPYPDGAVFYPAVGWGPSSSTSGSMGPSTSRGPRRNQGYNRGRQNTYYAASGSGDWPQYAYAAVPCVIVPTGGPIFYSQHPQWQPGRPPQQSGRRSKSSRTPTSTTSSSRTSMPCRDHDAWHPNTPPQQEEQQLLAEEEEIDQHSDAESEGSSIGDAATTPSYELSDQEATSWGSLTVGVVQAIVSKLADSEVKQLRLVCQHWRAAVDHNLEQLTPSSLKAKQITMRFPNLKMLHLTNCANVRNRDLKLLSSSGLRLHTLLLGDDANKPWVTNVGLSWIAKIPTLTALTLQDCTQVTNKGLSPLNQLSGLSALSLKGCSRLTNGGLQALQSNTALTSLNLAGCLRVSDKGLLPLSSLPNLLYLHLGNTRVRDEGMQYLARITSLHELHFAREAMTDFGIGQLSTLTNLQTLALRECPQVSGDALSQLVPQLSSLQSLDLFQSYEFDDSQLAKCLDFLGSVTFLDLRGTVVSEEGIQQLARLQNLQKLCLAPKQELRVEHHLCVISHLTQLTSLAINNCKLVSFDLMESLRHLKLLRELDISNSGQAPVRQQAQQEAAPREPVNNEAIKAMASITSLTSIDLSRRSVHEEHLSVLAERLPRLRTLFVVGCPVLYDDLQALQRRFPELVIHRKPVHDPPMSCSSSDHGF